MVTPNVGGLTANNVAFTALTAPATAATPVDAPKVTAPSINVVMPPIAADNTCDVLN